MIKYLGHNRIGLHPVAGLLVNRQCIDPFQDVVPAGTGSWSASDCEPPDITTSVVFATRGFPYLLGCAASLLWKLLMGLLLLFHQTFDALWNTTELSALLSMSLPFAPIRVLNGSWWNAATFWVTSVVTESSGSTEFLDSYWIC